MSGNILKKFKEVYGEALEEEEKGKCELLSAPRIEGLIKNKYLNVELKTYGIKQYPDSSDAVLEYEDKSFSFRRIEMIIKNFTGRIFDFEVADEGYGVFRISEKYSIILAPMVENEIKRFRVEDDLYKWNEIFNNIQIADDEIL